MASLCETHIASAPELNEELASLCKALGHPARVQILKILIAHRSCIYAEIVEVRPLALDYRADRAAGNLFPNQHVVTLAFWQSGFFKGRKVIPYIIAQSIGAIAASATLLFTLGPIGTLGATLPLDDNWSQSLVLETILTFILMVVIVGSGLDRRARVGLAGLAIGLTVGLEATFMGPITGASMNPVRSLGPALIGTMWQHHWLYWIGPIFGAQLAVVIYRYLSNNFRDFSA